LAWGGQLPNRFGFTGAAEGPYGGDLAQAGLHRQALSFFQLPELIPEIADASPCYFARRVNGKSVEL
jgi:hypothetical protein